MDLYTKTMTGLMQQPAETIKQTIGTLAGMCVCPGCVNYTQCAKDAGEGLFCAHGSSFKCIQGARGPCNCGSCPVAKQVGLSNSAFCLSGSEAAQRYFQELH